MNDDAGKLDALTAAVADVRVLVAGMAGDLRTLVTGFSDHEARLRLLEGHGIDEHSMQIKDLQAEVRSLREWRLQLIARAGGVGGLVAVGGTELIRWLTTTHL